MTLDALLIDQIRNPSIKRVGIKLTIFDLKIKLIIETESSIMNQI